MNPCRVGRLYSGENRANQPTKTCERERLVRQVSVAAGDLDTALRPRAYMYRSAAFPMRRRSSSATSISVPRVTPSMVRPFSTLTPAASQIAVA